MAKRSEQPSPALTRKQLSRAQREARTQRWVMIGFGLVGVLVIGILAYAQINTQILLPNRAVATIGQDKITVQQLQDRIKFDLFVNFRVSSAADLGTDTTTVGKFILDSMIDEVLIRQQAQAKGISVTDAEVDRRAGLDFGYDGGTPEPTSTQMPTDQPIVGSPTATSTFVYTLTPSPTVTLPAGITATPTHTETLTATSTLAVTSTTGSTTPLPTDITATPILTRTATPSESPTSTPVPPTATTGPTSTPVTKEGYNKQLEDFITTVSTTTGLSKDRVKVLWRDGVRNRLYRQKLEASLDLKADTQKEVAHVAHILVDTQEAAQAIIDRIAKGEEFPKLAAELSKDTSNAYKGGDLGWIEKGQMVPEFEDAAFNIPVGEISAPVQTQYGWHVLKVYARTKVPATAQDQLTSQQKQFSDLLAKWRTDANVVTDPVWFTYITQ